MKQNERNAQFTPTRSAKHARKLQSTDFRTQHILAALIVTFIAATFTHADVTVIKTGQVHLGNGEVIENGMVIVRDGRIASVGKDLSVPSGANVIELSNGVMTPGLIDANALIEPRSLLAATREARRDTSAEEQDFERSFAAGGSETMPGEGAPRGRFLAQLIQHDHEPEDCAVCDQFAAQDNCAFAAAHEDLEDEIQCPVCGYPGTMLDLLDAASGVRPGLVLSESSSETVPHTHVIDSLNLRSPDFQRLLHGGVTTVFASPDTSAVIGPRGAILRTAGPVRERTVSPSNAVTASISTDPFRGAVRNSPPRRWGVTHNSRRPNTRMGLTWVFRKAFHDAIAEREGRPYGGADTPPEEAFPILQQILAGGIPLRIHARQQNDIETAIRLGREFDIRFTLLEATEAYKSIDAIREADLPVIFGPIWIDPSGPRTRMWDSRDSRLSTMVNLVDAGVTTALSAQDLREGDGLARQMMYAVRAGLAPSDALKATTSIPAKLLGIDDRVGTLEAGKDAELVVWNAAPYEPGARPRLVMIGGRIVHEN